MTLSNPFLGLITALITPFKNDKIDYASLEKIINHQIDSGIKAIVIAGSTGEGATLSFEEYNSLIKSAIDISKSRINIIAGCTSSSTSYTISLAKTAQDLGADALMCSPPPYNKPTQSALYAHFKALHDATNLPIMLYAAPSRAAVDFTDNTIVELSNLPRILAIKDCAADLERPLRILNRVKNNFHVLSGDDSLSLAYNGQGASGLVSVASNIFPKEMTEVQESWNSGDLSKAISLQKRYISLYKALFIETNPIPVKFAASILGLCSEEMRMPLQELSASSKEIVSKDVLAIASLRKLHFIKNL